MTLKYLSLAALKELDGGRVYEAFDQAMKRVVADCEDRPGEERPRTITLKADLMPVRGDDGRCEGVMGTFRVAETIPNRKSKTYSFGVKADGRLFFSTEDPTNVQQYGLGDVNATSGRAERGEPEEEDEDSES